MSTRRPSTDSPRSTEPTSAKKAGPARRARPTRPEEKEAVSAGSNPFELGEAIRFGLLFGVITFVAKAAQVYLGDAGLYLAGAIAGLTDVDAISLSMAQLAAGDASSVAIAGRTIVIAVASNTLFKAGMVAFLGAAGLRNTILFSAAVMIAVAVVAAVLV